MKRQTAVRHVREIAEACSEQNSRLAMFDSNLRLVEVWAFGPILDGWDDDDYVSLAAVVNLEPHTAHWLSVPGAAEWLQSFAGWGKRPVNFRWRSNEAPVWNHEIVRPAAVWTAADGVAEHLLADLAAERSLEASRLAAPEAVALRDRLEQEKSACLTALGATTDAYWDGRWGPGKPFRIADPVARAATGLVDVELAIGALSSP